MTIYVIEDHPLMREAIAVLLRRMRPGAKVIELSQLSDLQPAVAQHGTPALLCLDLRLPDSEGLASVHQVKAQLPTVPLAVISSSPADEMASDCRKAGANLYIEKSTTAHEMANALRALLPGDGEERTPPEHKLSKRQKQLLLMLDEGLSNREIAERLEISEHTVKVHLWRLFRRLGVNSRTQSLHYARRSGLLAP